jgi:hypothetical protein
MAALTAMKWITGRRRYCREPVRPAEDDRDMTILIRTSDVPQAQRHEAWRSIVCDTLGPLDMRSDPGIPLRGEIGAGQLGPVRSAG